MKLVCVITALLCLGYVEVIEARAQMQQGFPSFPGLQGGFPGGGFPGLSSQQGNALGSSNKKAMEELRRQCLANGSEKDFKEVEAAAENMQTCMMEVMPKIQTMNIQSTGDICKFMHKTLHDCLLDFTKKWQRCLDKNSAYIPGYSMEVLDSVFNFICKDDAKHVMTLMMSMAQPGVCLLNLRDEAKDCFSKTKYLKRESDDSIGTNITRPQLCSDSKIVRDCIIGHAKSHCSGEQYEFVTGITNAMHEPCSACRIFITNTFILAVLFILTKLF